MNEYRIILTNEEAKAIQALFEAIKVSETVTIKNNEVVWDDITETKHNNCQVINDFLEKINVILEYEKLEKIEKINPF